MHEQHPEDAKQRRHAGSEPSYVPCTDVGSPRLKWFNQDGRKISVGDTALFRAGNALPFIGIIRKVITDKEGALKLRVNWLYRPGDIELGKGVSLDASPNEVFYSFHKDVISAASLLHPCKVAFLPKGVDLPPEVSSLVCRRVYDTTRKCLYWLTDRDYADEHQGEVDRLLKKTKHEMQPAGQSDKPSQRVLSEVKLEAVNAALGKAKKRERTDQLFDSTKRERHSKEENMELKRERALRFEDFAFMAEKDGGLSSVSLVDQLVQVMTQERIEGSKNIADVVPHRIILVGLVAAIDKEDCLSHFVRCGGLPVLDDWLQEAHKGSLGDGHHKENDKTLEELLFMLLRALERLPVDLDALRTCNVGKSVNLLKNHVNFELQKKARTLVETWKKRVNAEMNQLDEAKSGPTSTITRSSRPGMETTLTAKGCFTGGLKGSSSAQLAINGSVSGGEGTSVSAYKDLTETGASKTNSLKAHAGGASDAVAAVKEEKSCSSSQSWCSGSGKSVGSLKDEGKIHSVASLGNKTGSALRSHSKGHYPTVTTSNSLQRDSVVRHKTSGAEKMSNLTLLDKKGNDLPNHSSQRLIVRLPNPGRSPAHSTSGGCLMDGSGQNSKGASSGIVERHDAVNANHKAPESHSPGTSGDTKCANSIIKAGKIGIDHKEDVGRSCIDSVDGMDYKSSDIKPRSRSFLNSKIQPATHVTSKRGTNLSEITIAPGSSNVNAAGVPGEMVEGGIDLLASVAACEGSGAEKSVSEAAACGEGFHPPASEANRELVAQARALDEGDSKAEAFEDGEKKSKDDALEFDCKPSAACVRECAPAELNAVLPELSQEVLTSAAPSLATHGKEDTQFMTDVVKEPEVTHGKSPIISELTATTQDAHGLTEEPAGDTGISPYEGDYRATSGVSAPESQADDCHVSTPSALDNVASVQEGSENGSKDIPSPSTLKASPSPTNAGDVVSEFYCEDALEVARQVAKEVEQEVQRYGHHEGHEGSLSSSDEKELTYEGQEPLKRKQSDTDDSAIKDAGPKLLVECSLPADGRVEAAVEGEALDGISQSRKDTSDVSCTGAKEDALSRPDSEMTADVSSLANDRPKVEGDSKSFVKAGLKTPLVDEIFSEKEMNLPKEKKLEAVERPVFDLNEGLASDEAFHDRMTHALVPVSSSICLPDRPGSSVHSSSLAAPVAVVSAMKGSFNPPCNIPRPKVEFGWKGSAATSAFRPAEPRRVAETVQSGSDATALLDAVAAYDQDGRHARVLDIDLNVADEKVMEETNVTSVCEADAVSNGPAASRPELDLNRVDGSDESPLLPQSNGRLPMMATRTMLDFDLNDGLGCEEPGVEEVSSHRKNFECSSLPVVPETRPTPDFVNVIPWYSSANSLPAAMMIPAFPATRPDLPYPVIGAPGPKSAFAVSNTFSQFGGNTYQGVAPISSVNVGYPPTTFPHAGYPLGAGFPFSSTSYSMNSASNVALNNTLTYPTATPSQLVSAGAVVAPFGRPYLGGCIGDGPGSDSLVSWARPSLDLNADVITELDSKDEGYGVRPNIGQLQYQQVGALSGPVKRKEPEGGFDAFRSNFKQMAWRE